MTVRQFLRWHLPYAWDAESGYLTRYPCKICGQVRRKGREVFDRHGWSNVCERDFRRFRVGMGLRGILPAKAPWAKAA